MVKHIVFDVGQVLVNVSFLDFAKRFASTFEIDAKEVLDADENGPHKLFMTGEISGEEFHRRLCDAFNKEISLEDLKQLWFSMLDGQKEDTAGIVKKLVQKGNSLAILSNIDVWHYHYCEENYPVMQFFPKKFLSFELKLRKPDERIFKLVADELNANPESCLLVDDKLENIESAKAVGFQAIQFLSAEDLQKKLEQLQLL